MKQLTEEFARTGRIRIETDAGGAWLVASLDQADDIREGAVYPADVWPTFVKLDPEHRRQVHDFMCDLGGARLDRIEDAAGE